MLYTLALVPFILILTWESVSANEWQTRHYCRITVACMLSVSMAFWL